MHGFCSCDYIYTVIVLVSRNASKSTICRTSWGFCACKSCSFIQEVRVPTHRIMHYSWKVPMVKVIRYRHASRCSALISPPEVLAWGLSAPRIELISMLQTDHLTTQNLSKLGFDHQLGFNSRNRGFNRSAWRKLADSPHQIFWGFLPIFPETNHWKDPTKKSRFNLLPRTWGKSTMNFVDVTVQKNGSSTQETKNLDLTSTQQNSPASNLHLSGEPTTMLWFLTCWCADWLLD